MRDCKDCIYSAGIAGHGVERLMICDYASQTHRTRALAYCKRYGIRRGDVTRLLKAMRTLPCPCYRKGPHGRRRIGIVVPEKSIRLKKEETP